MSRLILLNGAPATGKSTLARRYADDHPLTLVLDLDTVRGLLGGWLDRPSQAGLAARALAIEMARVHLAAGHDTIVPQYLGRIEFVLQLQGLCDDTGVEFVEIALLADDAAARFARRSAAPETAEHRAAAALPLDADAANRVAAIMAQRPNTRPVVSIDGEIDATYRALLAELDATPTTRTVSEEQRAGRNRCPGSYPVRKSP